MDQKTGIYLVVIAFGILMTAAVGQILIRTGASFLEEVFADRRTASSATRLIAVLFHLVVLGALALISIVNVGGTDPLPIVVTKVGIMLLVLGAAYGLTLLGLVRIRNRHRDEDVQEELTSQFEAARARYDTPGQPAQYGGPAQPAQYGAPGQPAQYGAPGQPRPVIDTGGGSLG